jgi:curved DNA-binding protein CbpA
MREHHDLYAILGVPATASAATVRHAYRAELRRHHPDTRDPDSHLDQQTHDSALRQVLAAYAVLHDPERRADYDRRQRSQAGTRPTARPGPPVVVLGGARSAWSGRRNGITPVRAGPSVSGTWLVELFRGLGPNTR